MNIKSSLVILVLSALAAQSTSCLQGADAPADPPPQIYDVKSYGAVGDGATLDTPSIQRAIDDCSAKGGGTVLFPAGGHYLIGTIYLKSNINLNVAEGAEIIGTTSLAEYGSDTGISPYYPEDLDKCLIYAKDAKNITLSGAGAINGGFTRGVKTMPAPNAKGREKTARPMLVRFDGCENIRFESLKFYNSCSWCLHFVRSKNIALVNLDVPNRAQDGVDFESCENALVTGCHFVTGDDSVVVLASHNQPSRNITVTDCTMQSSCAAVRLGPLSYGDVQGVTVTNCQFGTCNLGGIKIGMYEGGTISDCKFTDITMNNVTCPILIFLGTFYEVGAVTNRRPQMPVGKIHDLTFSNIKGSATMRKPQYPDSNSVMFFQGYPGTDIENITLNNVQFTFPGGGTKEQAERRDLTDMDKIDPLKAGYWTDHKTTFGIAPASVLYARHVRNLRLNNVEFMILKPDARAAVFLNQTSDVTLDDLKISGVGGDPVAAASLLLLDSQRVNVRKGAGNSFASAYLVVEGSKTKAVHLQDVDFSGNTHPVATTGGAVPEEIQTTTGAANP